MKKPAAVIMIQGTASNVGKSILTTALCRIFKQDGYSVAPFKSQNMALNAYVTPEGGQIGLAQALQAEACGILPTVDMNPILLKPEKDRSSELVVQGKSRGSVEAGTYSKMTKDLLATVMESLNRLRSEFEIVVIEGAGSPAEINLNQHEIANMRIAREAKSPVILVGSIEKGGVYAFLYGTVKILDKSDRARIKGFVVNKLRGEPHRLQPANEILKRKTGIPVLGVLPYYQDIKIAEEDNATLSDLPQNLNSGDLDIAVVRFPYLSNYDDFDTFTTLNGNLRYVNNLSELGQPHIIVLPNTNSIFYDLKWLRETGLAQAITQQNLKGTIIIGICGGYEIMGLDICDNNSVQKSPEENGLNVVQAGLAILPIHTVHTKDSCIRQVNATLKNPSGILLGITAEDLKGFESHNGHSTTENEGLFQINIAGEAQADGAINSAGNAFGTNIHHIFHNVSFTSALFDNIREYHNISQSNKQLQINRDEEYEKLATLVRKYLNIDKIYCILGLANPNR